MCEFAEHQPVALVADRPALAQQLEVERSVDRVAVEAGTDQLVVLDHQFLVDAAVRIAHHDLFAIRPAHEVAGREQVDAGHLQFRRGGRPLVAADAELRQVGRADLALLEQWCDQPVRDAAVRRAFTDRVDARIGDGLHRVVDDDAAAHVGAAVQADLQGQLGVGADAGSHHHQVGGQFAAVLELHCGDAAGRATDQRLGLGRDAKLHAARLQRLAQHVAGHVVELALHQPRREVHQRDIHAARHQAVGGLQTQQPATDDDRMGVRLGGLDHRVGVGDVAECDHADQVAPRQRRDERVRAGRDQQPVVRLLGAVLGLHDAPRPVDIDDPSCPGAAGCRARRTRPVGFQHDLVQRLLAGQHPGSA